MYREITIVVTEEEARRIDARVASGEFASASDYVHSTVSTALTSDALDIPDDVLQALLEDDDADSDPGIPADNAFAQVKANLEAKYGKS